MPFSPHLISRALSETPMEVDDGMREGSSSSLVLGFLETNKKKLLSHEDIAWIDYCLNKDSSYIERNWDDMRGALLKIFNSKPGSLDSTVLRNFYRRIHSENFSSSIAEPANIHGGRTDCDDMLVEAGSLETSDDLAISGIFSGNVSQPNLLPNYSDDLQESIVIDLGISADQIDPSAYTLASIFNSQPESLGSAAFDDKISRETDMGSSHCSKEVKHEENNCTMVDDDNSEVKVFDNFEEINAFLGKSFWSDYDDESKYMRSGRDIGFSPYQNEPSTDEISRVCDPNTPTKDSAFIKKWTEASEESSSQSEPSSNFNTGDLKDSTEMSIKGIDNGLKKLSVRGHSS